MCQNRPLSRPPRSKNGSTISSQVSFSTLEGGGSVAPALRQSSSHTRRPIASTTTGGTTLTETALARASARVANGVFLGAIASTLAGVVGKLTAVSVLRTGMFISVLLQLRCRAAGGGRALP